MIFGKAPELFLKKIWELSVQYTDALDVNHPGA